MTDAFKAMIEKEARRPVAGDYYGYDWWQLSDAEERVFSIEIGRMPQIVTLWQAYEAFKDKTSGARWDTNHQALLDTVKAARPDLAAQEHGEAGWIEFAVAFSNLTMREAWQWWMKHEAWQDRNGIMQFADGS